MVKLHLPRLTKTRTFNLKHIRTVKATKPIIICPLLAPPYNVPFHENIIPPTSTDTSKSKAFFHLEEATVYFRRK
jgi:hypothetical protein